MAGLDRSTPVPIEIKLRNASHVMELSFTNGATYQLPFEYLRVFSPSAEVRGHGVGQGVLQTGKRGVTVTGVEPVGNYAVKILFSDGHNSGLYSWDVLYNLAVNQKELWQEYLNQLEAAGASRDVDTTKPFASGHHGHSCKH